jgi:predicted deacylase
MYPSEFHPSRFERNSRYTLDLKFEAGGHSLALPVILVRGARTGKTLVVTAGVHGDEYEGIQAILEISRELDPASMAGDFLAVPVANPPAFWNGTRTSPLDGGNLARVFPGDRQAGPTAAIAWHLTKSILPLADFYLDLHSAGVKCLMPTLIGYDAADERSREAAFLFGTEVVWAHPTIAPGRTISAARAMGIPCLYTEARGAGRIDPDDLQVYRRGVRNLLRHLGIISGVPETVPCRYHLIGDGNIHESVSATKSGFLMPEVDLLEPVNRGRRLGTLVDLKGCTIEEYAAPCDGLVALIHACPLVSPGEPVFLVTGLHL